MSIKHIVRYEGDGLRTLHVTVTNGRYGPKVKEFSFNALLSPAELESSWAPGEKDSHVFERILVETLSSIRDLMGVEMVFFAGNILTLHHGIAVNWEILLLQICERLRLYAQEMRGGIHTLMVTVNDQPAFEATHPVLQRRLAAQDNSGRIVLEGIESALGKGFTLNTSVFPNFAPKEWHATEEQFYSCFCGETEAIKWPLFVHKLFQVAGVVEVSLRQNEVHIKRSPAFCWSEILPGVLKVLQRLFQRGEQILVLDSPDGRSKPLRAFRKRPAKPSRIIVPRTSDWQSESRFHVSLLLTREEFKFARRRFTSQAIPPSLQLLVKEILQVRGASEVTVSPYRLDLKWKSTALRKRYESKVLSLLCNLFPKPGLVEVIVQSEKD